VGVVVAVAGAVAVGTVVVGVAVAGAAPGARLPGWAPLAGVVVAGVVAVVVVFVDVPVAGCTRAEGGTTGRMGVELAWLVVLAIAPVGGIAASATVAHRATVATATLARTRAHTRELPRLALTIIVSVMLTAV
jgi:hypothetical protein